MLTQQRLKFLLKYDPLTGDWTWLWPASSRVEVGQSAGTISVHGYRIITIYGTKYRTARLAYLYMKGEWPPDEMDHENRCKLDDRWENLRPLDRSNNALNRDLQSNNTSGARGVSWNVEKGKWCAQIKKDNVTYHLGYFDSFNEAVAARDSAAAQLHGDFAVLNEKVS